MYLYPAKTVLYPAPPGSGAKAEKYTAEIILAYTSQKYPSQTVNRYLGRFA
jgi:hypothetical protein